MLLSALTLAALLQAAPVTAKQVYVFNNDLSSTAAPIEKRVAPSRVRPARVFAVHPAPPHVRRMKPGAGFVRYPLIDGCATPSTRAEASASTPKALRLNELAMANHTLAVLRSQGGCEVSSTVRYNVGR